MSLKRVFLLLIFALSLRAETIPQALYQKLKELHYPPTTHLLVVSLSDQTLSHYKMGKLVRRYPVSTARNGPGAREGSEQTPLGLHLVGEKYGANAPLRTIFRSRVNTKEVWEPGTSEKENLVLTRILTLDGLEEGINRGRDPEGFLVDSRERYVYIHGTNHEKELGKPTSLGCVRMGNADIAELYSHVPEGSLVWLTK